MMKSATPDDSDRNTFSVNHYTRAVSIQRASTMTSALDFAGVNDFLNSHHWPMGLQHHLQKNVVSMPLRFFICDDSASMAQSDGQKLVVKGKKFEKVSCSRWSEMCDTIAFLATLNSKVNLPAEFRMANSSGPIVI